MIMQSSTCKEAWNCKTNGCVHSLGDALESWYNRNTHLLKSKQILILSLSIDIGSNWNCLLCEVLHKIMTANFSIAHVAKQSLFISKSV